MYDIASALGYLFPVVLIALSFAIVGKGNRQRWVVIGPCIFAGIGMMTGVIYLVIPSEPELLRNLFLYSCMSINPGLTLWAAASIAKRNRPSNLY